MYPSDRAIVTYLDLAENITLGCKEFPTSTPYYVEADSVRIKMVCIALASAYDLLTKSDEKYPDLRTRLYQIARRIIPLTSPINFRNYIFNYGETPEELRKKVRKIAAIGRSLARSAKKSEEERIGEGNLFIFFNDLYAASIPSKHGPFCSNCNEPVATCTQECPNCGYQFIGPFEMPDIEEWRESSPAQKRATVLKVLSTTNRGRLKVIA